MEVSVQLLAALTQEKFPVTHFTGGWVGLAADPGVLKKGKFFLWPESNSGLSNMRLFSITTTAYRVP
jgi:hypothetical protein